MGKLSYGQTQVSPIIIEKVSFFFVSRCLAAPASKQARTHFLVTRHHWMGSFSVVISHFPALGKKKIAVLYVCS